MANLGYIQVTRVCNQHCLFCSNPENYRTLSLEEAEEKVAKLKRDGYQGVILTGGEPTLHPKLSTIVRMVRNGGLHVRMITNGQLTAEKGMLESLVEAGLQHIHISVHTARSDVQAYLTSNSDSWVNLSKTFRRIGEIGLTCDVNTVICAQNADHLDETVRSIVVSFPFVRHFVWNNIDSKMNRVSENSHTVARLSDLELSLSRAVRFLRSTGRTYRIERVPLCYMADFAYASTETRKIIKGERRTVHFLDDKGEVTQSDFFYAKGEFCRYCTVQRICAGLYDLGGAYDPSELNAIFLDPGEIEMRVKQEK